MIFLYCKLREVIICLCSHNQINSSYNTCWDNGSPTSTGKYLWQVCIIVKHCGPLKNEKHNYAWKWDCLKCTLWQWNWCYYIAEVKKMKNMDSKLFTLVLNTLFHPKTHKGFNLSEWKKVAGGAKAKLLRSLVGCKESKACYCVFD